MLITTVLLGVPISPASFLAKWTYEGMMRLILDGRENSLPPHEDVHSPGRGINPFGYVRFRVPAADRERLKWGRKLPKAELRTNGSYPALPRLKLPARYRPVGSTDRRNTFNLRG